MKLKSLTSSLKEYEETDGRLKEEIDRQRAEAERQIQEETKHEALLSKAMDVY